MSIIVDVADIMRNNNDETDVSYVSIAVSNATDLKKIHNYSINSITKIDTLNATFSYNSHYVDHTNLKISVYITVVDRCTQESLPEVINCTPRGIYYNNNMYYDSCQVS